MYKTPINLKFNRTCASANDGKVPLNKTSNTIKSTWAGAFVWNTCTLLLSNKDNKYAILWDNSPSFALQVSYSFSPSEDFHAKWLAKPWCHIKKKTSLRVVVDCLLIIITKSIRQDNTKVWTSVLQTHLNKAHGGWAKVTESWPKVGRRGQRWRGHRGACTEEKRLTDYNL